MKTAIYTRVSSTAQKDKRQIEELKEVCMRHGWTDFIVLQDKISGYSTKAADRDGFSKLSSMVQDGSIQNVVVHEVSRIARRISQTADFIDMCCSHSVNIFIKNIGHNTMLDGKANPLNSIITGILSSVSQYEVEVTKARQQSGIAIAKKNNVYKGRKRGAVSSKDKIIKRYSSIRGFIPAMKSQRMSLRELNNQFGVSVNTIRKLKGMLQTI